MMKDRMEIACLILIYQNVLLLMENVLMDSFKMRMNNVFRIIVTDVQMDIISVMMMKLEDVFQIQMVVQRE